MKHCIKTLAAVLLFTSGALTPSYGQNMYAGKATKLSSATIIAVLEHLNKEAVAGVDPAATASFSVLFPNAAGQKWIQKDGCNLVSFLNDGHKAMASLSPRGALNYLIMECGPDQLPKAFCKKIKKSYAAYRLLQATEIQAYGQKAYQAILENAFRYITLKYTAGVVEEIQTVKK